MNRLTLPVFNMSYRPVCPCGGCAWDKLFTSFAKWPERHYHCLSCKRWLVDIGDYPFRVIVISNETVSDEWKARREVPTDSEFILWIAKVLVSSWRVKMRELEAARKNVHDLWEVDARFRLEFRDGAEISHERKLLYDSRMNCINAYSGYQIPWGFDPIFLPPHVPPGCVLHIQTATREKTDPDFVQVLVEQTHRLSLPDSDPVVSDKLTELDQILKKVASKFQMLPEMEKQSMPIRGPHRGEYRIIAHFGKCSVTIEPDHIFWRLSGLCVTDSAVAKVRDLGNRLNRAVSCPEGEHIGWNVSVNPLSADELEAFLTLLVANSVTELAAT